MATPANNEPPARREQLALRTFDDIRTMIVSGELLPGQPIRQEHMADLLQVSRLPVRAALQQLLAEGLVTHQPNAGFTVARLSRPQFNQIYLMRDLLETVAIRSLPTVSAHQIETLRNLNQKLLTASSHADVALVRRLNMEFHFSIFHLSPMDLVVEEIERIWGRALPYQAIYIDDAEKRAQIVAEHERMIDALAKGDLEVVVTAMKEHRKGASVGLTHLLRD